MIAVISPAKSLDETPLARQLPSSELKLGEDVEQLSVATRRLSAPKIRQLMSVSDALAKLNRDRFRAFELPMSVENAKQAVFLFAGDTYRGLEASTLTDEDVDFLQDHVRILSGFYGIARPLDLIQPYRLEMGTSLPTRRGPNLYKFWGNRITDALVEDLASHDDQSVVHLASKEYFSAIKTKRLPGRVITCTFRERRDDKLRFISFSAKRARGMMARFMVKHRLTKADELKAFAEDGYDYRDDLSSEDEFFFVRADQR